MNLTRRRLLRKSAQGLAFSAGATLMPPNVQKVLAQGPRRSGSIRDIKHVVMLTTALHIFEMNRIDNFLGISSSNFWISKVLSSLDGIIL